MHVGVGKLNQTRTITLVIARDIRNPHGDLAGYNKLSDRARICVFLKHHLRGHPWILR